MATSAAAPPSVVVPGRGDFGSGSRGTGAHRTGMLLGLAAVSMMFIGLTSAYVVSSGLDPLWKQVPLRPLIWINTAVLLVSSYTMERARRGFSAKWLAATLLLGLAFVAGQIGVFAQLADVGLHLSTGRQASFYYVLTSLHGLHILGGVAGLSWAALQMKKSTLDGVSMYWHFMGGLWIYLLLVIFL